MNKAIAILIITTFLIFIISCAPKEAPKPEVKETTIDQNSEAIVNVDNTLIDIEDTETDNELDDIENTLNQI